MDVKNNGKKHFISVGEFKQQRLYIPEKVSNIIMHDKDKFGYSAAALGTFINALLINLINYSDLGNLSVKREELEKSYSDLVKKECLDVELADRIAKRLADEDIKRVKKRYKLISKSESRGSSFQLTLNKQLKELLSLSEEAEEYDQSIKDYLEAILKEYSDKPYIERESLFFYKTIYDLETCIKKKTVKLVSRDIQFYFRPYKIGPEPGSLANYVMGYSRKVETDKIAGETNDFAIHSFRIDAIRDLTVTNLFSDVNYEQESKLVMKRYTELRGFIQYSAGELMKVVVKFTDEGDRERKGIPHRNLTEWTCDSEKEHIFSFKASEIQACNYLRRLSGEFEVISPPEIRKKMHELGESMAKRNE